jgi:predicted porin
MKPRLLASTALIAAGTLAAPDPAKAQKIGPAVQLRVGGFMDQYFGVVFDRETANTNGAPDTTGVGADTATSFDQKTDAEIHFRGSGKLDNGIEVGAHVELEVAGSPGNMIDEQYLFVRGSFGQFIVGAEDNAGYLMTAAYAGTWSTSVGQNLNRLPDWISAPAGVSLSRTDAPLNEIRLRVTDNDSNKVSYFTPRVAGFQLGASYIPNFTQNTQNGTGATELGTVSKDVYHEGWALGLNFDRKFDGIGIGIAAGYLTAKSPGVQATQTATRFKNTDDMSAYIVAARVDFGPFRIAGAFRENMDVRDDIGASFTTSLDGSMFDVGARYTFGRNAVSIGYVNGEAEGAITPGDDKEQDFIVSYRRTLAPGVAFHANLFYVDVADEVSGPNSEVAGWALTTAIRLDF